jgi:hypothetical protein
MRLVCEVLGGAWESVACPWLDSGNAVIAAIRKIGTYRAHGCIMLFPSFPDQM